MSREGFEPSTPCLKGTISDRYVYAHHGVSPFGPVYAVILTRDGPPVNWPPPARLLPWMPHHYTMSRVSFWQSQTGAETNVGTSLAIPGSTISMVPSQSGQSFDNSGDHHHLTQNDFSHILSPSMAHCAPSRAATASDILMEGSYELLELWCQPSPR